MLAVGAVTTDAVADGAITADKIVGGTGSNLDADQLDGHDTAYFATVKTVTDLQYEVTTLRSQVNMATRQFLITQVSAGENPDLRQAMTTGWLVLCLKIINDPCTN